MEENRDISSDSSDSLSSQEDLSDPQNERTQSSLFEPTTVIMHQIGITEMEVSIEIENDTLAKSMSEKLKKFPGNHGKRGPITIFRVPEYIRNKNKELYEPQIVSIGPYHHGAARLRAMEEQKWMYLGDLLSRSRHAPTLVSLVKNMRSLEVETRRAYSESFSFSSDEFVEMMVLDGCFIIEFLLKSSTGKANAMWVISLGHSDLFLLENQIPFFIISRLYSILQLHHLHKLPLNNLLSHFMFNDSSKKLNLPNEGSIYHLVHLHYDWFVPKCTSTSASRVNSGSIFQRCFSCADKYSTLIQLCFNFVHRYRTSLEMFSSSYLPRWKENDDQLFASSNTRLKLTTRAPPKVIPCASSLREAGVKFKRKKKPNNLFHVTFEEGTLELPSILIDNSRKRLFLNLVAFEQSDRSTEKNLTSFATLMDMLINTPSDVEILEECDILQNMLPSAEEAASFFNQICECATLDYDDHYLAGLFDRVRDYCDSTWHKNRARLVRDYFHNPWAILSFIAAITLLILSFVQSFFSVFGYFRPPH